MARSDIRFLLGFEPIALNDVDPNQTVLDWLRESMALTGTKEGCAEGDCGACTVVLADVRHGELLYKPVNACIVFLPQLDGRQLITVEHLKGEAGEAHPVQQAMVDHHGSQCGFCTPGFVQALFAFSKQRGASDSPPTRKDICNALQGNLCRCTGYRPILAASGALHSGPDDVFDVRKSQTITALEKLDTTTPLVIQNCGRSYRAPISLEELATAIQEQPTATLLAGSTDVGLWVTKQHRTQDQLIDMTRVPELSRIEKAGDALKIGAACTYQDAHAVIAQAWPDFGELIRRIGGAQVRAMGTIGGNVANGSPIGDTMPALIALGSTILLRRGKQQRRLPLEDFYLDYRKTALQPGEFVVDIDIPTSNLELKCYKISKRLDQDISAVLGAFALAFEADQTVKDLRIAFGGMAAVPKRASNTERAMIGKPWNMATIKAGQAALAKELAPISDMRASASYRLIVAQNLLMKAFIETTTPETATRVLDVS
ncbi:MAG: xanthine dehydrogenase small subunit [Pseudomonadota bacterium]